MKQYIEPLHTSRLVNKFGDAYGVSVPSNGEIMDKLNEVIAYLNRAIGVGLFPLPENYKEEEQ